LSHAVVYHIWGEEGSPDPGTNLNVPVIPSIATLRNVNPTIPIYVLDGSQRSQHWGRLPLHLGFKVIPIQFFLNRYRDRKGWKHLSRLFDLHRVDIPEDVLLYCDTDVFWAADPLPLHGDPSLFCFDKFNTGFFYYDKRAPLVQQFFEIFEAYAVTALNDEIFRIVQRQFNQWEKEWYFVYDETLLAYMHAKHRELFWDLGPEEHLSTHAQDFEGKSCKMIHAHGVSVENGDIEHCRGVLPYVFDVMHRGMKAVLTPQQFDRLYPQHFQAQFPAGGLPWDEETIRHLLRHRSLRHLLHHRRRRSLPPRLDNLA
jgi:hypothetical protein